MFGSSQTLGLGAGFGATQGMSQAQSPEKKAKQEDKQTCTPATVRLLLDAQRAAEQDGNKEIQLHGAEVANLILVGVVEGLLRQAAVLEFTLNDGSGRVKVRHYKSDGDSQSEKESTASGQYVSVVGSLRTSPAVHVSALSLRRITSADEVSYHMIDVAHTALQMRRTSGPDMQKEASKMQVSAPEPSPQPTATAAAAPAVAPVINAGNPRSSVLEVLRTEGEKRPEGVPLAVVLEHLKSLPEAGVRSALEELVNDGEAYTTIDENHFSLI